MFLLILHRNSRQMRIARLDAKANKRKIGDKFLLASLGGVAIPNPLLRGYFLNAGGKGSSGSQPWTDVVNLIT
jgi:hypothetical protein